MPKPDYTRVELDVEAGQGPSRMPRPESDTPFRILVMGDFSGRALRGAREPLAGRKPVLIDRDNFEALMQKLNVRVGEIDFRDLDDFHPDRLYARLNVFSALREKREQLSDPSTFAQIKAQMAEWAAPAERPPSREQALTQAVGSGNLLDDMVEATETRGPSRNDPFEQYLRAIVAPHLVPKPDPRQAELISAVDQAIAAHMREVLHHPDFQSIEAAWRGLFFMIRELETGPELKVYLLDVTQEELLDDLAAGGIERSALYKLLVEQTVNTPGALPWSLIAGAYSFGLSTQDLTLLGAMGSLGRRAGAPFLAGARSILVGCKSVGETPSSKSWKDLSGTPPWGEYEKLRRSPGARHIGLALPRFLLRLPYGKGADAPETFAFEEANGGAMAHESYLWGNPVFACVMLIGAAFSESGWDMRPGDVEEVRGLPLHVYKHDGESLLKPCAEALLTIEGAQIMMENGLIPLLSMKDSDRVRIAGFRSIAPGNQPLSGRWEA